VEVHVRNSRFEVEVSYEDVREFFRSLGVDTDPDARFQIVTRNLDRGVNFDHNTASDVSPGRAIVFKLNQPKREVPVDKAKTVVIAGTSREYQDWCKREMLSGPVLASGRVTFIRDEHDLRGLRPGEVKVVLYGTFWKNAAFDRAREWVQFLRHPLGTSSSARIEHLASNQRVAGSNPA
jgi:hypothetical protein